VQLSIGVADNASVRPVSTRSRDWLAGTWAVIVAMVFGACGASGSSTSPPLGTQYDSAVQATFLRSCEASAGTRLHDSRRVEQICGCALRYVEAHASQATLTSTERAILKGEATLPSWMRDAVPACVKTGGA
jgi:hypothetical protein